MADCRKRQLLDAPKRFDMFYGVQNRNTATMPWRAFAHTLQTPCMEQEEQLSDFQGSL